MGEEDRVHSYAAANSLLTACIERQKSMLLCGLELCQRAASFKACDSEGCYPCSGRVNYLITQSPRVMLAEACSSVATDFRDACGDCIAGGAPQRLAADGTASCGWSSCSRSAPLDWTQTLSELKRLVPSLDPDVSRHFVDREAAGVQALLGRLSLRERIGQMLQLDVNLALATGEDIAAVLDGSLDKSAGAGAVVFAGALAARRPRPARDMSLRHVRDMPPQARSTPRPRRSPPARAASARPPAATRGASPSSSASTPSTATPSPPTPRRPAAQGGGLGAASLHAPSCEQATVLPHNIGLGAADDESLTAAAGAATATEVAAAGLNWAFGPCVASPRDSRWGRTYEGFGADEQLVSRRAASLAPGPDTDPGPAPDTDTDPDLAPDTDPWLVRRHAAAAVTGLQAPADERADLTRPFLPAGARLVGRGRARGRVAACAKHFAADGATRLGHLWTPRPSTHLHDPSPRHAPRRMHTTGRLAGPHGDTSATRPRHAYDTPTTRPRHAHDTPTTRPRHAHDTPTTRPAGATLSGADEGDADLDAVGLAEHLLPYRAAVQACGR